MDRETWALADDFIASPHWLQGNLDIFPIQKTYDDIAARELMEKSPIAGRLWYIFVRNKWTLFSQFVKVHDEK